MQAYFLGGKSCLFMLLVLPSLIVTEEDWGGIATLGVAVARVKRRRQEMRKVLSLSLSLSFLSAFDSAQLLGDPRLSLNNFTW